MFSAGELSQMRRAYDDLMHDTCQIESYTVTGHDLAGAEIKTWTLGANIPCGFYILSVEEKVRAQFSIAETIAALRLPFDTDVDERDRVHVRGHTFEVVSPAQFGLIGTVVTLRQVTL